MDLRKKSPWLGEGSRSHWERIIKLGTNADLFRPGEQAGIMVARNYEEYVRDGKRGRRANGDGRITERRRNLWGSKVQEDDYGWHQLIAHIKLPMDIMNVPKSKNLNISVVGRFSWFNWYTLHYMYWNGMLCHLKIYTLVSQLKMESLFPKPAFRVLEVWGQFSASLSWESWSESLPSQSRLNVITERAGHTVMAWKCGLSFDPGNTKARNSKVVFRKFQSPPNPALQTARQEGVRFSPPDSRESLLFQDFPKSTSSPSWPKFFGNFRV